MGVVSEREGAVVDGHSVGGAELGADVDGLRGRHVDRPHEPLRLVSSDRQQSEADGGKAATDLGEEVAIARITGDINIAGGCESTSEIRRSRVLERRD